MTTSQRSPMWPLLVGGLVAAYVMTHRPRRYDFRDRTVLITGGSRGLGLILARQLGHAGARVAICGRDAPTLERARVDLQARGIRALAVPCDVTVREEVDAGHRAYVVCARIHPDEPDADAPSRRTDDFDEVPDFLLDPDASDASDRAPLRAVLEVAEELRGHPRLAGLDVGVLHGQMPPADKDAVMADFANPTGPRPDSQRPREYLEQFPLDTLKMVGTLRLGGGNYGLVQTKDGLIHRVLPGNHLGQNDGRVMTVSDAKI